MNDDDIFGRIGPLLDAAGIPAMLTGSHSSGIYGLPRSTLAVDLVIDPSAEQLSRFVTSLPPDRFCVSLPAALDALRRRSLFNVLDHETGLKFDFIIRKDRPFSQVEFGRRTEIEYFGRRLAVATAEDVILTKLEWSTAGGSLRQIEDAAGILKVRDDLDAAYLAHWVAELDVAPQWAAACAAAGR